MKISNIIRVGDLWYYRDPSVPRGSDPCFRTRFEARDWVREKLRAVRENLRLERAALESPDPWEPE